LKTGHDQLIGLGERRPFLTSTVKLVDPAKNFSTAWTFGDDTIRVLRIVGPFGISSMLSGALLPGDLPRLLPTDVNGDGTLDFVIQINNKALQLKSQYLVVDAKGTVLDTINDLAQAPLSSGLLANASC